MLRFLKSFFGKKNEPAEQAPYKVETPVVIDTYQPVEAPQPEPVKCGCGRSASGLCIGLHKLTPDEWAGHADNPKRVTPPPAKKAPAKKKPADKTAKPAAITASKKRNNKKTPA